MHRQNNRLHQRPLGYSAASVMVLERPPDNSIKDSDFLQRFKNELAGDPHILGISATSASFNRAYDVYGWDSQGKHLSAYIYSVDPSPVSVLKMTIQAGRDFKVDAISDVANPIIVNESFLKQLGPDFSIGSTYSPFDTLFEQFCTPTTVGVVNDYNFLSLHDHVGPALPFTSELYSYFQLLVPVDDNNLASAVAAVEQAYEHVSSGLRCNWSVLEDDLASQYTFEQRWSKIISSSAVFTICIACLGMFGPAGISAVRRRREVSVRKVLGATIFQVVRLVNREFLCMVLAANVIAWPIACYSARKWLQNFAFPIELSLWNSAFAALIASTIVMIAVSAHTLKSAPQNQSSVLRHE
ncbi:MAG: FtsX-like permease family protein [Candidatus Zixiibacteriota bacterium]